MLFTIESPAYIIYACLSLILAVILTFDDNAVYNIDSN